MLVVRLYMPQVPHMPVIATIWDTLGTRQDAARATIVTKLAAMSTTTNAASFNVSMFPLEQKTPPAEAEGIF